MSILWFLLKIYGFRLAWLLFCFRRLDRYDVSDIYMDVEDLQNSLRWVTSSKCPDGRQKPREWRWPWYNYTCTEFQIKIWITYMQNSAGHGGRRCETERKTESKIHGYHQKRYEEEWADRRQHSRPQSSTFSTAMTGEWQFPGRPTDVEEPSRWERDKYALPRLLAWFAPSSWARRPPRLATS